MTGFLNRQTTLPPVGRGPRLRRFAPFRSTSRASPPSSRGVCLIFSSCPGPLTTMTGSELAGHRLLEVLVAPCCGTALLARRGGARPPLKRPPPPGAVRLLNIPSALNFLPADDRTGRRNSQSGSPLRAPAQSPSPRSPYTPDTASTPAPPSGRSRTPRRLPRSCRHPCAADRRPGGRPGPIVVRRRCRTGRFVRHETPLCVAQMVLWVIGVAQIPLWVRSVPQPPGYGLCILWYTQSSLCISDRGFDIHKTVCRYQGIHNRSPSVMASRRGKAYMLALRPAPRCNTWIMSFSSRSLRIFAPLTLGIPACS